jgi:hypothetical protein
VDGVVIRTEVPGPDPAVTETRLVRSAEVVVLVVWRQRAATPTSGRPTGSWPRWPTAWGDPPPARPTTRAAITRRRERVRPPPRRPPGRRAARGRCGRRRHLHHPVQLRRRAGHGPALLRRHDRVAAP